MIQLENTSYKQNKKSFCSTKFKIPIPALPGWQCRLPAQHRSAATGVQLPICTSKFQGNGKKQRIFQKNVGELVSLGL